MQLTSMHFAQRASATINKPRAMSGGTFPLVQGLKNIINCGTPVKKKKPLPVHARLASCIPEQQPRSLCQQVKYAYLSYKQGASSTLYRLVRLSDVRW